MLKNAIDFLYAEWNNKVMGVVSYGAVGGTRAAEHLRLIAGEVQMAGVRTNVAWSLFTDFRDFVELTPGTHQRQALDILLGRGHRLSQALGVAQGGRAGQGEHSAKVNRRGTVTKLPGHQSGPDNSPHDSWPGAHVQASVLPASRYPQFRSARPEVSGWPR